MKQARVLSFCGLGLLFALGISSPALKASDELKLGTASGSNGDTVDVKLTMGSASNVQGVQAAFDWNGTLLDGVNISLSALSLTADSKVKRIEPAYGVVGLVMDTNPDDGTKIINPGTGIELATVSLKILVGTPQSVPLTFHDGVYAAADLGPNLNNLFVVGGLSVEASDGLALTPGSVNIVAAAPTFQVVSKTVTDPDACPSTISVTVQMKTELTVQGFQTAVAHQSTGGAPALTLVDVTVGPAAAGADFIEHEISGATGGTLGVVMDFVDPFGTPLPIGPGTKDIALYKYCLSAQEGAKGTKALPCHNPDLPPVSYVYNLNFVDNQLGDPVKENLIVVNGGGVNPVLKGGTLTLVPSDCTVQTVRSGFAAGGCQLCDVLDESGNPVPGDPLDPNKHLQLPCTINAHAGDTIDVGLWYKFPPSLVLDETIRPDLIHQIQGLSMAVCYDSQYLHCKDGEYSLDGTITQTVGAEFVNVHCQDVDTSDPDHPRNGELIVGILVDALPPFDGQYLPPTDDWLKVICVKFVVKAQSCVPGGACSEIQFCDGANGAGNVPTRNLFSVANFAWKPDDKIPGKVCVSSKPVFIRGDCNGTFSDPLPTISPDRLAHAADIFWPDAVDISDAAAVISWLFETGDFRFIPPCMDACDANDDGRVDLADSVYILRYLFKLPNTKPPAPFDTPGTDDQEGARTPNDRLDCKNGSVCATVIP